jgi:DNA-binding response OmpR family regulator
MILLPKKVLIVEDELITQRYIKNSVEEMGIEVIGSIDNAPDVLQILKAKECNMILMDINIKGQKDGIILAREILRGRDIPILFISAYSDDETIEEILEFSSDGFVSKPFTSRELEIALRVSYRAFVERQNIKKSKYNFIEDIVIDEEYRFSFRDRELYYHNRAIKLTNNQLKLLELLLKHKDHTVSVEEIRYTIWGKDDIANSTMRTLVYSLRKLLPSLNISNHSKIGYSINI